MYHSELCLSYDAALCGFGSVRMAIARHAYLCVSSGKSMLQRMAQIPPQGICICHNCITCIASVPQHSYDLPAPSLPAPDSVGNKVCKRVSSSLMDRCWRQASGAAPEAQRLRGLCAPTMAPARAGSSSHRRAQCRAGCPCAQRCPRGGLRPPSGSSPCSWGPCCSAGTP